MKNLKALDLSQFNVWLSKETPSVSEEHPHQELSVLKIRVECSYTLHEWIGSQTVL